jgi:hypothetical protein
MRTLPIFRILVAMLVTIALSTSAFAGDLRESAERAGQQQAQAGPTKIDHAYLWPGTALFVAGMSVAVYGFLHTNGGEFVSGQVSKESKTGLGGAGLAVAGAGGALLFLGSQRAKKSPSLTFGPGRVELSHHVSW